MRLAAALAAAAALLVPAAAAAQAPVPPPAPAPAPPPPPPVPQIAMTVAKVHRIGGDAVVLRGSAFRLRGTMTPVAPVPQLVELWIHRGDRVITYP